LDNEQLARQYRLSRPLIYLKFKNKEDLFAGVFDYLMEGRFERAEEAAKSGGPKRERLFSVCEILLVDHPGSATSDTGICEHPERWLRVAPVSRLRTNSSVELYLLIRLTEAMVTKLAVG
jgi:AcrR family transcriptional regulator